ncbi:uncharacterized protein [Nicotiana tomentosiformis]|uniref:uncharacterized protein n=1 Tax=Nicotiana tomentosiformis TaxID=4098 RepID=UPI00388CE417
MTIFLVRSQLFAIPVINLYEMKVKRFFLSLFFLFSHNTEFWVARYSTSSEESCVLMEQLQQLGQEGFHFRPTDSEGLTFLLTFVSRQEIHDSGFITTNVDVYGKQEPWEIYDNRVPCGDDEDNTSYHYFITELKKKSKARYHCVVGNKGSWKQDAKGKPVHYKNMGNASSVVNIGSKTCLPYVNKKFYPEDQKDGRWLMKEYELSKVILHKFD